MYREQSRFVNQREPSFKWKKHCTVLGYDLVYGTVLLHSTQQSCSTDCQPWVTPAYSYFAVSSACTVSSSQQAQTTGNSPDFCQLIPSAVCSSPSSHAVTSKPATTHSPSVQDRCILAHPHAATDWFQFGLLLHRMAYTMAYTRFATIARRLQQ